MSEREEDEHVDVWGRLLPLMLNVMLAITLEAQSTKGNTKA